MEGWVKIHRQITNWEWYTDGNTMRVFLHLLLSANREDKKWKGIILYAGQCVTSIEEISKGVRLSFQSVRTSLNRLKSTGEITSKTTNKYSIITITNYVNYQCTEEDIQQANQQASQQTTNKQTTNKQQANQEKREKEKKKQENNKEIKEGNKKEENNIKNNTTTNVDGVTKSSVSQTDLFGNNDTTGEPKGNNIFVKPTIEQVKAYHLEKGYAWDVECFYDYYESNGWHVGRTKMKSWKAAMRNWDRTEKEKKSKSNGYGIHQQRQDRRGETPAPDWDNLPPGSMDF